MTTPASNRGKESGTFYMRLKGKNISYGKIDAKLLGEILIDIQTLIYYTAEKVTGKGRDRKFYDLYRVGLKRIEKGSAIISLEPMATERTIYGETPLENTMKELFKIVNLVNDNPDEGREYLLETLRNARDRLVLEGKLYSIWPDNNLEVGIRYDGIRYSSGEYVSLKWERKEVLNTWLEEDMREASRKIRGIITRIKTDGRRRYFTLMSVDGSMYKYEYTPVNKEIESEVIDLIKTPVEIIGIAAGGVKSKVIKEILELKPLETIEMEKIGKYDLKQPLKINIAYDAEDDLWVLENKELRIFGVGDTFEEALERLEENLEVVREEYLEEDDSNLTDTAKILKKNLERYIVR